MKKIVAPILVSIVLISCNSHEKSRITLPLAISEVNKIKQNSKLIESIKRGSEIYADFCINCHLPNGKGVPKTFPPLAKSDYLMSNIEESMKGLKYGVSGEISVNHEVYNGVMAAQGLSNDEIADVMNYILNSWGNSHDKLITEEEVSGIEP